MWHNIQYLISDGSWWEVQQDHSWSVVMAWMERKWSFLDLWPTLFITWELELWEGGQVSSPVQPLQLRHLLSQISVIFWTCIHQTASSPAGHHETLWETSTWRWRWEQSSSQLAWGHANPNPRRNSFKDPTLVYNSWADDLMMLHQPHSLAGCGVPSDGVQEELLNWIQLTWETKQETILLHSSSDRKINSKNQNLHAKTASADRHSASEEKGVKGQSAGCVCAWRHRKYTLSK